MKKRLGASFWKLSTLRRITALKNLSDEQL